MCLFFRKYAIALRNSIGSFEAAESDENGRMEGGTLRVKIKINIKDPLKRGTNVKIRSMVEKTWIPITYKKIAWLLLFLREARSCYPRMHDGGSRQQQRKALRGRNA